MLQAGWTAALQFDPLNTTEVENIRSDRFACRVPVDTLTRNRPDNHVIHINMGHLPGGNVTAHEIRY